MTKSSLTNRGKEELLMTLGKGFKVLRFHAVVLLFCLLSICLLWKFCLSHCLDFVSQSRILKTCLIVKCVVYFDFWSCLFLLRLSFSVLPKWVRGKVIVSLHFCVQYYVSCVVNLQNNWVSYYYFYLFYLVFTRDA